MARVFYIRESAETALISQADLQELADRIQRNEHTDIRLAQMLQRCLHNHRIEPGALSLRIEELGAVTGGTEYQIVVERAAEQRLRVAG